jgi:prophage regulatory protein
MADAPDRFLRFTEVTDIVGFGRTYIYRLIRDGKFPAPHKPGGASSRWSEAEVRAWMERVKAERAA